jgi:hypothetical protein
VPPREWRVRVNDIIDAAERAVRYTDGLTFDEFRADARTVGAVARLGDARDVCGRAHAEASERPLPRAPAPALHPRFGAV